MEQLAGGGFCSVGDQMCEILSAGEGAAPVVDAVEDDLVIDLVADDEQVVFDVPVIALADL